MKQMQNIQKTGQVYASGANQGIVVSGSGTNQGLVVNQGANQGMVLIQPERQIPQAKQPGTPQSHQNRTYNLLLLDQYKTSINFKIKIPSSEFNFNLTILIILIN